MSAYFSTLLKLLPLSIALTGCDSDEPYRSYWAFIGSCAGPVTISMDLRRPVADDPALVSSLLMVCKAKK